MNNQRQAVLALEDGAVYPGWAIGSGNRTEGEVVFNTSLTGYEEVLTDPSYRGQIVCMTYPLIGNYGFNREDMESRRIYLSGFIVKEACPYPSNWRSTGSLQEALEEFDVLGISGIDTRSLVKKLRVAGVMRGVITTASEDYERCVAEARAIPSMAGQELVTEVTTESSFFWDLARGPVSERPAGDFKRHILVYDFGVKFNILRSLAKRGNLVEVVPAQTTAEEALAREPDGIMLSNGPGDPEPVTFAIRAIQNLIGQVPIFGICLGHQLLGCAIGAGTYKLKFGHRGGNQPVQETVGGRVFITAQNHGFCVNGDRVREDQAKVSLINLNDNTVEGMSSREGGWFSVQYHPEACPGPHDAAPLFDQFMELIDQHH
ncbi:MAG: glutamine-hydrolyzing carbamoyl-phosphate synthase small subunit [Candidatus Omnitrophica bacterium]|nr:Carbamoyl-phosphate synthase small chain [bacterium]NUN95505.1 glutamine-hydrolyzing carbamoyl-phosphate synthase small subunit [Candidatus Omnitrophota bacterium]